MKHLLPTLLLLAGCEELVNSCDCLDEIKSLMKSHSLAVDDLEYFAEQRNKACCEARYRGLTGEWPGCGVVEEFGPCIRKMEPQL